MSFWAWKNFFPCKGWGLHGRDSWLAVMKDHIEVHLHTKSHGNRFVNSGDRRYSGSKILEAKISGVHGGHGMQVSSVRLGVLFFVDVVPAPHPVPSCVRPVRAPEIVDTNGGFIHTWSLAKTAHKRQRYVSVHVIYLGLTSCHTLCIWGPRCLFTTKWVASPLSYFWARPH